MAVFSDKTFVLYDFDGVFVDSMQTNLDVTKKLYNQEWDLDEYRRLFMGNVYDNIDRDYAERSDDKSIEEFFSHYGPRLLELSPFEKVGEMLAAISGSRTSYIVTSSPETFVGEFLKKHKLDSYIVDVFGYETHKSKVKKCQMLLEKEDKTPEETVFITDTVGDVLEADEVGIDAIAVTWGFHPKSWFKESPHHTAVDTIDEMIALF